jgi:hypothetical protein
VVHHGFHNLVSVALYDVSGLLHLLIGADILDIDDESAVTDISVTAQVLLSTITSISLLIASCTPRELYRGSLFLIVLETLIADNGTFSSRWCGSS